MKQAQIAAQKADEAAKAAVDKYRKVNAKGAGVGTNEQLAEAHRLAEQIRAQEASKAAETATAARNIAETKYNGELQKLRKQQLLTDRAEEILMRAEKAGGEARAAYTQAAAQAAQAARDAAMTGAAAAGQAASQAEADEMASAARAAQRRAIVAVKSAKDAADKANIAANIARLPPQPKPTLPPCEPLVKGKSFLQQPQGCALLPEDGTSPDTLTAGGEVASSVVEAAQDQAMADAVRQEDGRTQSAIAAAGLTPEQVPEYLTKMLKDRGVNQAQPPQQQQPPQQPVQMAPDLNAASSQPAVEQSAMNALASQSQVPTPMDSQVDGDAGSMND